MSQERSTPALFAFQETILLHKEEELLLALEISELEFSLALEIYSD
jgi:hypothetical protein